MSQEMKGPVLTRYEGQRIFAGDVIIEVVQVSGGKVRLKVTAPDGVAINREEVMRPIQRLPLKG